MDHHALQSKSISSLDFAVAVAVVVVVVVVVVFVAVVVVAAKCYLRRFVRLQFQISLVARRMTFRSANARLGSDYQRLHQRRTPRSQLLPRIAADLRLTIKV